MTAPVKSCFWGHSWSKWTDKESGNVTTEYGNNVSKFIVGTFVRQERRCTNCWMVELRTEKSTL